MKKVLICFVLSGFICIAQSFAQDAEAPKKVSPWKFSGSTSLNFTQTSYSDWAAGGTNGIDGTVGATMRLNYKKEKLLWENTLIMGYGLKYQGSDRRKIDDKIDFTSKLGYLAFKNWYYTFQGNYRTQFDKGYAKYPVTDDAMFNSKFMSPAYITLSLGMDYKPCPDFSLVLSPVSSKFTLVLSDTLSNLGAFGVKPGRHSNYEFGSNLTASYVKKLHKNITLDTKLELFTNLLKNPENVYVNWRLTMPMQITKYIGTRLELQLIYDDKVKTKNEDGSEGGPKLQFRELLHIGFTYNF
jgi:hypothetical protein